MTTTPTIATIQLEVDVTAQHIAAGIERECARCPVALALTAALVETDVSLRQMKPVVATSQYASVIGEDGRVWRGPFPQDVSHFIRMFDAFGADSVKPFRFELQLSVVGLADDWRTRSLVVTHNELAGMAG